MRTISEEGVRYVMGTLLHVSVDALTFDAAHRAHERVLEIVQRLERSLTIHRPDSDLSLLNQGLVKERALPGEVQQILSDARHYAAQTGGAFNPSYLGQWDLGAFAKGWAMDRALDDLKADAAVTSCRFNFGGQLLFWNREDILSERIQIELPSLPRDQWPEFTLIRPGSVSTSAPFERGFHIIDPRSRKPVTAMRSVTVVAPTAAEADAWSTALFVRGAQDGLKLLEGHPQIAAYFVDLETVPARLHFTAK